MTAPPPAASAPRSPPTPTSNTRQTTLSPLPLKGNGLGAVGGFGRDNGHLIVLGFMFHEAGHLRYSDATNKAVLDTYGSSKYKTTALMLSNLLDDERLERWFKLPYPGTIAALDASRRYMAGSYNPTGHYSNAGATNPHPKSPQYPRSITDKGDIRSIVTLGIAYDDFVGKPSTYFRDVRRCYMAVRLIVRMGLGEGPDTNEATVVATHLKQVAALIRLVNRYGKGLPEPEPKPEPTTTESGDEGDEGEDGMGSEPGPAWGDDDDDSDGEDNGSGSDESESESDPTTVRATSPQTPGMRSMRAPRVSPAMTAASPMRTAKPSSRATKATATTGPSPSLSPTRARVRARAPTRVAMTAGPTSTPPVVRVPVLARWTSTS